MAEEEKKKKLKKPTAKKRELQNAKKRLKNKSFKSKAKTIIRSFKESLKSKDLNASKEHLNLVFRLIDKGVKKKIFKKNKANRTKSQLTLMITEEKA